MFGTIPSFTNTTLSRFLLDERFSTGPIVTSTLKFFSECYDKTESLFLQRRLIRFVFIESVRVPNTIVTGKEAFLIKVRIAR